MTIRPSKPTKLSDTQLVLLSSASQRQDRCLFRSGSMTERAFARAVNALVKQGLVAANNSPLSRADDAPTVALTFAGLAAIGCPEPIEETRASVETGGKETAQPVVLQPAGDGVGHGQPTKRAQIIAMLSREEGASLDDLIGATGWLPHTTRAALTGLRQKGFSLERTQLEDGTSVYRIVSGPAQVRAA